MTLNEVMLSTGGDPNAQFVELLDPFGEPFPSPPYKVVIYDTNGTSVGSHTVSQALLASTTAPILISTGSADTALGVTGHEVLSVALPTPGQACFTRGMTEQIIHCVAWGCVATPKAGFPTFPAPPDSQSAQRQPSGSYNFGTPTPKAGNVVGTAPSACAPPPDTDGDGVPDSTDQCPSQPAQTANGCPPPPPPDADGDGVPDSTDQCPNTAAQTLNGCPAPPADSDGDGVPNASDECPDQPAQTANGCAAAPTDTDGDGDGVPNASDQCPTQAAATANGCPAAVDPDPTRATSGDDTLIGDARANRICGLGGDDTIRGGAGDDVLCGNAGDDRLFGERGNDRLEGGRGRDTLDGGKGKNRYVAGAGNDRILARNRRKDRIACGTGRDRARVDRVDVTAACERVSR